MGIVDYAHTPDALKNVLATINEVCQGEERVITVFGCGGILIGAKRPEMARIAAAMSALVVLTSDNPRSELPDGDPRGDARRRCAFCMAPVVCSSMPIAARPTARQRAWRSPETSCSLARGTRTTRRSRRSTPSMRPCCVKPSSCSTDRCSTTSSIASISACPARACSATSRSARRWPCSSRCSSACGSAAASSGSFVGCRWARPCVTSASKDSSPSRARPPWAGSSS